MGFLDGAFYLSDVAVKEMLSKTKNKGKRQRHLCSTQHRLLSADQEFWTSDWLSHDDTMDEICHST